MRTIRQRAAVLAARGTARLLQLAGRGGTALPGLLAERLAPELVAEQARRLGRGVVLVTGTNGKTTTATLLAGALRAGGLRPLHNAEGANLMRGLAAAIAAAASWKGTLAGGRRAIGVFEVDEAVAPLAARCCQPRVVVFTNLFRDQLDRYAELDTVAARWQELAAAAGGATLVVNADDPLVGALPPPPGGRVVRYGIADPAIATSEPGPADSIWCPRCGAQLVFRTVWFAHLGDYACPRCSYQRPPLEVAAVAVQPQGWHGTALRVAHGEREQEFFLPLPGVYNVANALGALAAALALGVPLAVACRALSRATPAFGRGERVTLAGRNVVVLLVKNPAGFTQALRTVMAAERCPALLLALNDRIADGRDVSWIWDADFEQLAGRAGALTVSGDRAAELALRLKYAGVAQPVTIVPDPARALDRALAQGTGTLYVLPTYTALLELHTRIARRAGRARFWERQ
ncbi:MAG: hypothetical protein KatS3mg061_3383 [Dehalococcoidia bacterium]|nr:MAG: hypothetical protein KatS3mg061_3383 [Dehalococcoidia bacterium]